MEPGLDRWVRDTVRRLVADGYRLDEIVDGVEAARESQYGHLPVVWGGDGSRRWPPPLRRQVAAVAAEEWAAAGRPDPEAVGGLPPLERDLVERIPTAVDAAWPDLDAPPPTRETVARAMGRWDDGQGAPDRHFRKVLQVLGGWRKVQAASRRRGR